MNQTAIRDRPLKAIAASVAMMLLVAAIATYVLVGPWAIRFAMEAFGGLIATSIIVRSLAQINSPSNWLYVGCVVNTVIFYCVFAIVNDLRHGVNGYTMLHSIALVWVAARAARTGTIGFKVAKETLERHAVKTESAASP